MGCSNEGIRTFSIACEWAVFLKFLNMQFIYVTGSYDRFHLPNLALMNFFYWNSRWTTCARIIIESVPFVVALLSDPSRGSSCHWAHNTLRELISRSRHSSTLNITTRDAIMLSAGLIEGSDGRGNY